jgi:heterodisulfide reductase subunit D
MAESPVAHSPKAKNLHDHLARLSRDSLAGCTACGKCVEACPMPGYSRVLAGQAAPAIVEGVLQVLRGARGPEAALEWINLCTYSARCVPACPEGVNPMLMLRVARMKAIGALGDAPQLQRGRDKAYFRRVHAFSALQLEDEEIESWQR